MQIIPSQKPPFAQVWKRQDIRCSKDGGMYLVQQHVLRCQASACVTQDKTTFNYRGMGAKGFPYIFILKAVLKRTTNLMNSISI